MAFFDTSAESRNLQHWRPARMAIAPKAFLDVVLDIPELTQDTLQPVFINAYRYTIWRESPSTTTVQWK